MPEHSSIFRIALIGPESTGKTTLCECLAKHYQTIFNPEYSRAYVENLGRKYLESDVIHCLMAQTSLEKQLIQKANKILFADTEAIMAGVWLKDVFNNSSSLIEKYISEYPYDLYLLTLPDLAFENDPVRENPHRRDYFFNWYEQELLKRKLPYTIIRGTGQERLRMAIHAIDHHIQHN